MSLPRQYRLQSPQDFTSVYQQGRKVVSKCLVVRALLEAAPHVGAASKSSRFGVTVSQKVSKRAVIRNRLKRQIHTAISQLRSQLLPGHRVVINVRPGAITCEYGDFLRELKHLLIKLEVLNGHS